MAQNRFYSSTAQKTTLNGGISNSATSIVVNAVTGFPVSYPYTLILERDTVNEEVIKVTGAASLTLTVVRGQDGTSAVAHSTGTNVEHGVSAQDFNEPQAHIAASAAVHGLAGTVVGTSDSQTLTNKTIALGSNTVSGTTAQFNTALSDNDFATLAGSETLTNKTLTAPAVSSPALSGTATGTLAGLTATGASLDAASTHGGITGTQLAASYASWVAYTPTFANCTSPAGNFRYRVDGKTLFIRGCFTGGTVTATAQVSFTLPAGMTISSTNEQSVQGQIATKTLAAPAASTSIVTTANPTSGASLVSTTGNSIVAVIELQ